jgi:hypothetical protein
MKTELVGGASLSKAALAGALKLSGPAVDQLFKLGMSKTLFDKVTMPIEITYSGEAVIPETGERLAAILAAKGAGKFVQGYGVEKWGKGQITSAMSSSGGSAPSSGSGQVVGHATVCNKSLLYFAFVNMDLGIARGW